MTFEVIAPACGARHDAPIVNGAGTARGGGKRKMEQSMSNRIDLIDRYFAIWNETDAERRRALIARTWSDKASYVDPLIQAEGHAGIDTMVSGIQERFPGHRFRRTSDVDSHHDRVRFSWELAVDGSAALAAGVDFGIVAADERLDAITGFVDQMPAQANQ
jgi:hypothetical protein